MDDLTKLKQAVLKAGKQALKMQEKNFSVMEKEDGTPVTEIDLFIDQFLKDALYETDKTYGWISEESPPIMPTDPAGKVWMIDPIDGTRALRDDIDEWTISAALIENHHVKLAVIYNPSTTEFFWAQKGKGAWLGDDKIHIKMPRQGEKPTVLTSKGHAKTALEKEWEQKVKRKWIHSIAYRLALVAGGQADATISLTPKSEWDIAAGHLLVEEAGGKILSNEGKPLTYNYAPYRFTGILAGPEQFVNKVLQNLAMRKDLSNKTGG